MTKKADWYCPDCREEVLIFDQRTGRPLVAESPKVQAVKRVWDETTLPERRAYHRVLCQNSRTPTDMKLYGVVIMRIAQAIVNVAEAANCVL